jgi:hypothetical protein
MRTYKEWAESRNVVNENFLSKMNPKGWTKAVWQSLIHAAGVELDIANSIALGIVKAIEASGPSNTGEVPDQDSKRPDYGRVGPLGRATMQDVIDARYPQ